MDSNKRILTIIMAIIVVSIAYSNGKIENIDTFSISSGGKQRISFTQNCSFITNIDYGVKVISTDKYGGKTYGLVEDIMDYNKGWISADINGDGKLEAYGYRSSKQETSLDPCAGKEVITYTQSGLRVVKYSKTMKYDEVAVCGNYLRRNYAKIYRNNDKDANGAMTECPLEKCQLVHGDGNKNKINIVITSSKFDGVYLKGYAPFKESVDKIVGDIKKTDPFSKNLDKFNIYQIYSNKGIDSSRQYIFEPSEEDEWTGEYILVKESSYDLIARECEGIINKPEDIVFFVDLDLWGFSGTVGHGGRSSSLSNCHYIFSEFCPAYAASDGGSYTVNMHEIGHAFTLNHDFSTKNIMSYYFKAIYYEEYQKQIIIKELSKFA